MFAAWLVSITKGSDEILISSYSCDQWSHFLFSITGFCSSCVSFYFIFEPKINISIHVFKIVDMMKVLRLHQLRTTEPLTWSEMNEPGSF